MTPGASYSDNYVGRNPETKENLNKNLILEQKKIEFLLFYFVKMCTEVPVWSFFFSLRFFNIFYNLLCIMDYLKEYGFVVNDLS